MNNSIKFYALILSLGVLNVFGAAPPQQQTITLVSSDDKEIEVSKDVADLSRTIKDLLEDLPPGPAQQVNIPGINEETLEHIFHMLDEIHRQIQTAQGIQVNGRFIAERVQPIANWVGQDDLNKILQVVNAANFLDLPFLVNGVARVYIDEIMGQRPNITLANLESILRQSVPKEIIPYFTKHFELKKANLYSELSIGDYISLHGQPEIDEEGLVDFDLSEKGITSLEGIELIENPEKIGVLNLSDNKIVYIPDYSFDKFNQLVELSLTSNKLTRLSNKVFIGLKELEVFDLDNNQLTALPAGIFIGLKELEVLNLHNNQLTALPDDVFTDLDKLEELNLYNNQLTALPAGIFAGLNNLISLILNGNKLKRLQGGLFRDLHNLRELDIANNLLESLSSGIFAGLSSLQFLNLANNQLTTLPAGIFANLNKLEKLNLYNNQLTELPGNVFAGLSNLQLLELINNPFKSKEEVHKMLKDFFADQNIDIQM